MRYLAFLLLAGCASVFDAPQEPLITVAPVRYDSWRNDDVQPCVVVNQGVWVMLAEIRDCKGWIPI